MYRLKLKAKDLLGDSKTVQAYLAKRKIKIIKTFESLSNVIYIVEVHEDDIHEVLYDLNQSTHYGVKLIKQKKIN